MQYNTQQKADAFARIRAQHPEYGRPCTYNRRPLRAPALCKYHYQHHGKHVSPPSRHTDFKHKLWDHLAIMADFKLDIDYPYEVIRKDNLITKPETVPYPSTKIRYRHYGRTLEVLIKKAIDFPEGDEKQNLVALICNHMKKDYMSWNKDTVDDRKIADDLAELSGGKLQMTDSLLRLMAERIEQNYRPKMNNQNNRNNNRNNKRKY
mgnify:CR=1 FL=1